MSTDARPNVLLITTDHWPARLLGCAGAPILTPTLDQLARSGVRFSRAYSECPVCIPARRSLMTGTSPRTHGDRIYRARLSMPDPAVTPTLAQCFSQAGYQTFAVGKLHVYPQRNRIGFDDVVLDEEGRTQFGVVDDYELFLADNGQTGRQFAHGLSNNGYETRPWHLDERLHPTNWATEQMARLIQRRDPTRPAFWYLSYRHPHPPLAPLEQYLRMYDGIDLPAPVMGDWATGERAPYACRVGAGHYAHLTPHQIRLAHQAFYALCTHIDHQLRYIIGTLREQGVLDNTIICFTSDHGDMLGDHGQWAKRILYESSANVPMILLGVRGDARTVPGTIDDRLVALRDVMPTLLQLAGVDVPASVEGFSMVGETRRSHLYAECSEGPLATRMVHDGRYKLIYYPTGNSRQLFDLASDPREMHDLAQSPQHQPIVERLEKLLIAELYGEDVTWCRDGRLVGLPAPQMPAASDDRGLDGQRGSHFPL